MRWNDHKSKKYFDSERKKKITIGALHYFQQAAHCILSSVPGSVSVFVGSSRRRAEGGRTYRALRVFLHPDYIYIPEPFEIYNDVAVIRTISRIEFGLTVQPIPLGAEPVPTASQVVATGWGLLGDVKIITLIRPTY